MKMKNNIVRMNLYKPNVVLLVLVAWCVPWWIYNRFVRSAEFHPLGHLKFPTPRWMSCGIPVVSLNPLKNNCENVKIDGWSIGHILIYATLGMLVPGQWVFVIVISILCEVFEFLVGWRARWIIDPVANLVGYGLGHLVFVSLSHWRWISSVVTTSILACILAMLLFLNRPSMIPRGGDFI